MDDIINRIKSINNYLYGMHYRGKFADDESYYYKVSNTLSELLDDVNKKNDKALAISMTSDLSEAMGLFNDGVVDDKFGIVAMICLSFKFNRLVSKVKKYLIAEGYTL